MERIDCTRQVDPLNYSLDLKRDIIILYMKTNVYEIFPCDYELYLQPDGRVALIDFDKFGIWLSDGSVETPWGETWTDELALNIIECVIGKIEPM
jgi:hypothetical protein